MLYSPSMSRPGGAVRLTTVLLALFLLCAGCATSVTALAPAAPSTPSSQAQAQDPDAPTTYRPVKRSGKQVSATVRASRGGLATSAPARYPDGIALKVKRQAAGVEKARGPGTFSGRQYVTFAISVSNGSQRVLDLNQVVVTAIYGSPPGQLAQPVYEEATARDFAGEVTPGRSATATYAFAVPDGQRGAVKLIVDFDDLHVPAEFAGAVR